MAGRATDAASREVDYGVTESVRASNSSERLTDEGMSHDAVPMT